MQLKLAQLHGHLQKTLLPVYVLHGDEPLLQIEAAGAIRAAGAKAGFDEREVLVADAGFDWDGVAQLNRSLSLFGSRRIVDLRLPTGKPGKNGGKVLAEVGAQPSPDNLLLVTCPRLDRTGLDSEWFRALEGAGAAIATPPLERDELPEWMGQRLARNNQRATHEVLEYLADLTEGNLLAAQQEIDKLALLLPPGELTQATIEACVANVARYDTAEFSDALLAGDKERTCRILAGLEAEGEGVQLVLWQLGEDTHGLLAVAQAARGGQGIQSAMRTARIWGRRQAPMERAARRVDGRARASMIPELARLDRVSKGIGRGEIWDETRAYALKFIGTLR